MAVFDPLFCYARHRKSVKTVAGVNYSVAIKCMFLCSSITPLGLEVGIMSAANQNKSRLARNQWEVSMETALPLASVGGTGPGKQRQSRAQLSPVLWDSEKLQFDVNSEPF